MKRIKRILCSLLIIISVLFLSACKKEYSSITYKRFTEIMSDELNYTVTDKSVDYQNTYNRYISASKEGIVFIYYEFEDEDSAKDYVKRNYDKKKYYSYKSKDDYSIVKYSKLGYAYLVQVDNMVIIGSTEEDTYKKDVKKAFNELGY